MEWKTFGNIEQSLVALSFQSNSHNLPHAQLCVIYYGVFLEILETLEFRVTSVHSKHQKQQSTPGVFSLKNIKNIHLNCPISNHVQRSWILVLSHRMSIIAVFKKMINYLLNYLQYLRDRNGMLLTWNWQYCDKIIKVRVKSWKIINQCHKLWNNSSYITEGKSLEIILRF